ncbi:MULTISPECIES: inverse autotransporter beta domain-containing protein [Enterobacteriaceae]|uniref:inverse autotransporter beta domain-containing protein n=1 Tax=Enterobacteriaceae TaxID=543 RepID=UPI0030197B09
MKTSSLVPVSLRMRLFAWLNIAVQAAFPLAVAFTPAVAGTAGSDGRFLHEQAVSAMQTRVYTLGEGESVSSVARKYNMSVDSLRKLNQFRTFAHGFDHLQAGDELDVPVAPLPEVRWDDTPSGAVSDKKEKEDDAQTKVAGYASQAGNFISASTRSDAAASMARGMASGAASGEIQQWLSRFGTARVQLDADKNFSLKNSQLDLLVPLYEQKDRLVFSQGSIHRTDDRTQANLGAGVRRFYDAWMFGANSFLDYDLSRDHARAGAGLEYWRDFLKLGFNGYIPLTGWKDSPDLTDYQERPARGWDVRAQYWLPALPQLGGKLTYEQYYGKEVALFGIDSRQRDPHAITAGINYTPVPLLTFSAEQRQGAGSNAETRFGVDMNYQLGMPWQHQINPDAVAAMRSLAGSRYDLVERNNNIVLEYRKKEVIRLKTADLVTGHTGEQKSLGVSVNSKYGLERIDWSASLLIAAGGKIVQSGEDWAVVMPVYRADVNSYTVQGVAVDRKGNRSNQAETQVTVQAPQVSAVQSTFTPATSSLAADGRSVQALTLSLRDGNNQAVDMDVKDISLKNSTLKSATVSALTRKSAGVYTVTVTAGTDVETVTLTPSVSGVTLSPAGVTISSTTPDAGQSVFTASPETIAADNAATSTLTLVAKDAQGNALTGLKDSLTFTVKDSGGQTPASGIITESAITESSTAGTYTATLKGTTAGQYTVVPEYNGTAIDSLSATVTLTATTPDQSQSLIARDKDTYVSGDDITIKVTLKDRNGTALTGDAGLLTTSTVTVPNATLKTDSSWKDNSDGTYTATYTAGTMSTDNQASLKLAGWDTPPKSEKYAITLRDEAPASINTHVNAYTFTQTSEEGTFPTTGFTGATFTIVPKDSKSATDYTWKSDASWVSVASGVVKFTGTGTGSKVTITGTPTSGQGKIIKYSFTLKSWFINSGATTNTWAEANTYCSSQSGYSMPTVLQMTASKLGTVSKRSAIGHLWNEWGDMSSYSKGFSSAFSWTSDEYDSTAHYVVTLGNGNVNYRDNDKQSAVVRDVAVVCRQGL